MSVSTAKKKNVNTGVDVPSPSETMSVPDGDVWTYGTRVAGTAPPAEPTPVPDRDWLAEAEAAQIRVDEPLEIDLAEERILETAGEVVVLVGPVDEIDLAEDRILEGLLRMADTYRATGSLRQGVEIYFELAHSHSGTTQAAAAVMRLLDVARGYEDAGELRQARGIYEHLLQT